jgi:hypothetical protein
VSTTTTQIARELLDEVRGLREELEELGYLTPTDASPFEQAKARAEQKRQLHVIDGGRLS